MLFSHFSPSLGLVSCLRARVVFLCLQIMLSICEGKVPLSRLSDSFDARCVSLLEGFHLSALLCCFQSCCGVLFCLVRGPALMTWTIGVDRRFRRRLDYSLLFFRFPSLPSSRSPSSSSSPFSSDPVPVPAPLFGDTYLFLGVLRP
ncbi:hypothetical protein B0H11DRAFT_2021232 [Mycena galericulata]|nr:hypothetical protein B0H11DRAFT_2021232 [Mycena galericulata]